jgi:hypothetical protein
MTIQQLSIRIPVWIAGPNCNVTKTSRAGAGANWNSNITVAGGTTSATLITSANDTFDGVSFSVGTAMGYIRFALAAAGTATAAMACGGVAGGTGGEQTTATFNGISWFAQGLMALGRHTLGAAGVSSSACISVGGADNPVTTNYANTENFNGASWSAGGALPAATRGIYGSCGGSQTAAFQYGGFTSANVNAAQRYNGSTWTSTTVCPNTTQSSSSIGTNSSAILAPEGLDGGGAASTVVRFWNDVAWITAASIGTARIRCGRSGNMGAAMMAGGQTTSTEQSSSEYYR